MITGMKNVVVFVRDIEQAKVFYKERLGLIATQESVAMMEFSFGAGAALGVALAMHEAALPLVGRHTGITLTVSDIVPFCEKLTEAGVTFAEPLDTTPWGKMAVVSDPDGNQFALVEG